MLKLSNNGSCSIGILSGVGILAFRLSTAKGQVSAELEPALKWTPNTQILLSTHCLNCLMAQERIHLQCWKSDPWVEKGMATHSVFPQSSTGSQQGHGVKRDD